MLVIGKSIALVYVMLLDLTNEMQSKLVALRGVASEMTPVFYILGRVQSELLVNVDLKAECSDLIESFEANGVSNYL